MQPQAARQMRWVRQGAAWLRYVAGRPVPRAYSSASQSNRDWLGWDAWVSVSRDEPDAG